MCVTRTGIANEPTPEVEDNLFRLCRLYLQPLRSLFDTPIVIFSGYRCASVNKAVGGAKNSYHLKGMAADFWVESDRMAMQVMAILLVRSEDLVTVNKLAELYYDRSRKFIHIAIQDPNHLKDSIYLDIK